MGVPIKEQPSSKWPFKDPCLFDTGDVSTSMSLGVLFMETEQQGEQMLLMMYHASLRPHPNPVHLFMLDQLLTLAAMPASLPRLSLAV